jgi:dCTP deaminase
VYLGILSDIHIRDAISRGEMEIDPFSEGNLTPNGYDLVVAEVLLPDTGDRWDEGTARVPAMTRFMISTLERVRLAPSMTAQLWLRTSWARRGVIASFGKIDAGFDGTLTFGALNTSSNDLELPIGQTFAQLVVEAMTGSAETLYAQRSGHYQDQRGVTMAYDPDRPEEGSGPHTLDAPCLREGCHECCVDTGMPLTEEDVDRLAGLDHRRDAFSRVGEDGFTFLNNVDGRCYFLDPAGKCSEYQSRPEGCRLYPLILSEEMSDFLLDPLCPHRDGVSANEAHRRVLLQLLDRLARERRPV